MKTCARCGIDKADEEFFYSATRNRLTKLCRLCHAKPKAALSYAERIAKRAAHDKRYRELKSEQEGPPPSTSEKHFRLQYGLTLEDLYAMFVAQSGRCAICLKASEFRLYVDHCHATGRVRGMLCPKCNSLLGFAGDDQDLLQSAISYLARHAQQDSAAE